MIWIQGNLSFELGLLPDRMRRVMILQFSKSLWSIFKRYRHSVTVPVNSGPINLPMIDAGISQNSITLTISGKSGSILHRLIAVPNYSDKLDFMQDEKLIIGWLRENIRGKVRIILSEKLKFSLSILSSQPVLGQEWGRECVIRFSDERDASLFSLFFEVE